MSEPRKRRNGFDNELQDYLNRATESIERGVYPEADLTWIFENADMSQYCVCTVLSHLAEKEDQLKLVEAERQARIDATALSVFAGHYARCVTAQESYEAAEKLEKAREAHVAGRGLPRLARGDAAPYLTYLKPEAIGDKK